MSEGRAWRLLPRRFVAAAGIIGLAFVVVYAVGAVRSLGYGIYEQPRIEWDYLVALVLALVLGLSILVWPVSPGDRDHLLRLWGVKCVIALGFMLLYEWNYGGSLDAMGYFLASRQPAAPHIGIGGGFENIGALAWMQAQVLPDSFHALKVSFAMVGMVAVYLIYRGAVLVLGREDARILYFIALFPSVLFWSSILGKEPVQLFGIGLYIYGTLSWMRTRRFWSLLWIAAGIWISMMIRVWTGPILLFPLAVLGFVGLRGTVGRLVLATATAGAMYVAVPMVIEFFRIDSAEDIVLAAERYSRGWEGGSSIESIPEFTSIGDMARYAPKGAFTALFRPLPGEVMNPFGMLAGIENLFLLVLVVLAFRRGAGLIRRDPLVLWALALIVTWSGFYGFASYNLGAVVRFKLQILPLMLLTLAYMAGFGRRPAAAASQERAG